MSSLTFRPDTPNLRNLIKKSSRYHLTTSRCLISVGCSPFSSDISKFKSGQLVVTKKHFKKRHFLCNSQENSSIGGNETSTASETLNSKKDSETHQEKGNTAIPSDDPAHDEDSEGEEAHVPSPDDKSWTDSLVSLIEQHKILQWLTLWPLWQQNRILRKLEREADLNPKDASKQAQLYAYLNTKEYETLI